MRPSRYLKAFTEAEKTQTPLFSDALWVERVPEEEKKTASGLIVGIQPTQKQIGTLAGDQPTFAHVLAVGRGYVDAEGNDVALSVEPGNIVLLGTQSVKWFSMLDINNYDSYSVGMTRESEVQMKFDTLADYERYFARINESVAPTPPPPDML